MVSDELRFYFLGQQSNCKPRKLKPIRGMSMASAPLFTGFYIRATLGWSAMHFDIVPWTSETKHAQTTEHRTAFLQIFLTAYNRNRCTGNLRTLSDGLRFCSLKHQVNCKPS
jgi:hypothetical protein